MAHAAANPLHKSNLKEEMTCEAQGGRGDKRRRGQRGWGREEKGGSEGSVREPPMSKIVWRVPKYSPPLFLFIFEIRGLRHGRASRFRRRVRVLDALECADVEHKARGGLERLRTVRELAPWSLGRTQRRKDDEKGTHKRHRVLHHGATMG